ncbi:MAG TPA: response regulator [Terriglobales bacterium]|nr:response regulator [Terriglobales bacterium]
MVGLQALAPSLKRRFHKLFGPKIEIIWIRGPELDFIEGDLAWIEDVIFEMAVRARNAMLFGGRLVVEWANIQLDEVVDGLSQPRPGRYVMFEMTCLRQDPALLMETDHTGRVTAFPEEWLQCDFVQAQSLIRSHGGEICEYNEPGRALTIRAFFPSAKDEFATVNLPEGTPLKPHRILLVEDENYVRDVACEILESEGYEVITARTGSEALEIVQQNGPVQLLLTDVVMPGMNGHELAEKLSSLHPGLKTIYMSGYTEGVPVISSCLETDRVFLQKPFTLEHLTTKVKQVLNLQPA